LWRSPKKKGSDFMKKLLLSSVAAVGFAGGLFTVAPASAQIVLPTIPIWDSHDETVGVGNFFAETWTTSKVATVLITDYAVPGDNYFVFLNGNLLGSTNVPDCTTYGADGCSTSGPLYAIDGNAGWASPVFAHFVIPNVAPGDIVSIEVKSLPTGFPDSTVALTTGVPEPATWAMMGLGFALLGFAAYRRPSKSVSLAA
jgi:hypothetical protein